MKPENLDVEIENVVSSKKVEPQLVDHGDARDLIEGVPGRTEEALLYRIKDVVTAPLRKI